MHYDIEKGVKANDGLFTIRFVIIMLVTLILVGIYAFFCFFAVEIFKPSAELKSQIDQVVSTDAPNENNTLRIPTAGIEVGVSDKNSSGIVYYMPNVGNGKITLMADYKIVGITPWETLRQSPLYNLSNVNDGDMIYLDYDSKRWVFKATKQSSVVNADLTINAIEAGDRQVNNSNKIHITAQKVGELVIKNGEATVVR